MTRLLLACNYLNIPSLFELCCATLASIFKDQKFELIKKEIGLDAVNYDIKEDQELMAQNEWILKTKLLENEDQD